jgi:putative toxin-antitoxin system antitoxin component (TIGR02293 family)
VRVARIVLLAEDVFGDPVKWLRKPKPSLGGESPKTVLATETGGRLAETMLHQLDHGITS